MLLCRIKFLRIMKSLQECLQDPQALRGGLASLWFHNLDISCMIIGEIFKRYGNIMGLYVKHVLINIERSHSYHNLYRLHNFSKVVMANASFLIGLLAYDITRYSSGVYCNNADTIYAKCILVCLDIILRTLKLSMT